jgi:hypothetical protein
MSAPRHEGTDSTSVYSALVVSSPTEVLKLADSARRLAPRWDSTLGPQFFLASLSAGWLPRVLVVKCADETIGIVYAKERRIAGVATGVIYADGILGNLVIADPLHREDVLYTAIRKLFACPAVLGVRLAIPPEGYESRAVAKVLSSLKLDSSSAAIQYHARLPLAGTYEEFLEWLGHRTRKNIRRCTRRLEAEGLIFVERLSKSELADAARYLRTRCSIPISASALERALNWIAGVECSMAIGIKNRSGEWLSFAAGWYTPGRATLSVQLNNDSDFEDYSLSLALRARLIEMLIGRGIKELWFWGGVTLPLARYAEYVPAIGVYLDVPGYSWRIARHIAAMIGPLLPRRFAQDMAWISRPQTPAGANE